MLPAAAGPAKPSGGRVGARDRAGPRRASRRGEPMRRGSPAPSRPSPEAGREAARLRDGVSAGGWDTALKMPGEPATPDPEEALRRSVEALARLDAGAAAAVYAPDAVLEVSSFGLEGVFAGRDAIRGFLEDMLAPYEEPEVVLEEFRDLGRGVTFVVLLRRGRPRGSRAVLARRDGHVTTGRDGLIDRHTIYVDVDEARAAGERLAQERG